MAKKTSLSYDEVNSLLMASPLAVFEWVQRGMLHAEVGDMLSSSFSREDLQEFARRNGMSLNRPDKSKLRILIVDSDIRASGTLVQLFDTLSETVEAIAVHSAFEAGRWLHSFRPDVVLLDMSMPQHEGFEICRRIKSDHLTRHVRVVALLGEMDVLQKQRFLMSGAEACLNKPIDHQRLFDVLGLFMDNMTDLASLQVDGYQQ
jgi:PleD family two-component response regulator